jgi:hypothetical protein
MRGARLRRHRRLSQFVAGAFLLGCGGHDAPGSSANTATSTEGGTLPACTRAAGLADLDAAASEQCRAARAYVTCTGEGCLSDDPPECPGGDPGGGTDPSCGDKCTAAEYGVACGGPGPTSSAEPPAGCQSAAITPGGVEFFCCPCL